MIKEDEARLNTIILLEDTVKALYEIKDIINVVNNQGCCEVCGNLYDRCTCYDNAD